MFELQDNIDLWFVHLIINHFGDTIILKNLEAVKGFYRVVLGYFFFLLKRYYTLFIPNNLKDKS